MNEEQITELLYQALETEIGGQDIYKAAIRCAANDEAREEWEKYLEETEGHERILREVFDRLGLDPEDDTPGREVVRHLGESLVEAMVMAMQTGEREAAQIVAAECIVLAETKDHSNWELIGVVAKKAKGDMKQALKEAYDQVEEQEDEHLYHTMGWAREMWFESLGLPAQLPPPEEAKKVKSAIAAARARAPRTNPTNSNGNRRKVSGNSRKVTGSGRSGSRGAAGRTAAANRGGKVSASIRSKASGRSTNSRTGGSTRGRSSAAGRNGRSSNGSRGAAGRTQAASRNGGAATRSHGRVTAGSRRR
jgi:rubrerythrin